MSPYRVAIVAMCAAGLLGCVVFVARYTWLSLRTFKGPWWRHETGWWLVAVPANLGALFGLVIANNLNADVWPGKQVVTLTLFTAYVIETWWPVRLLFKLDRPRRTDKEVSSDGPQTHP